MIFLLFLFLAVVVFIISIRKALPRIKESNADTWVESLTFWKALIAPIIIIILGLINPLRLERIEAGHIGLKVNLVGDNRGVSKYETGRIIYNTWVADLHEFPTHQLHVEYPDQVVITKGGFQAVIKPTFNYSLVAGNIGNMFQELRKPIKEVEENWLKTAIVSSVNDEANKWAVDSIFNNREVFEAAIQREANKRIGKWFTLSQLRTNIIPPASITKSIEEKTKAIQDVQVAENMKKVAEAEALTKIAKAKGDSAQAVINAAGRAEAIKKEQLSLTPLYIEYIKIGKWDGKLPQVQSGQGAGILMNLNK
jgi:fumarate reductase subunit D